MAPALLVDAPVVPRGTLVLAHGAGAPMDSAWMASATAALVEAGLRVVRFEFPYMAARRDGARRPPPKADSLVPAWRAALDVVLARFDGPVLIGGKSLGGRVATMTAADPLDPRVVGVVALGYPFHPPGAPEKLRLAPLAAARLPVTIVQGERDPFGNRVEVAGYDLPAGVAIRWCADGDHDLAPRRASGHTLAGHLATATAAAVAALAGTAQSAMS
nr:alpha/beta family hydrolase [Oharaeibacter diazotrophicus]